MLFYVNAYISEVSHIMMIDYPEFPPINLFRSVLRNEPKSAFLYIQLWSMAKKHHPAMELDAGTTTIIMTIKKSSIMDRFFISRTLFRNLLSALAAVGVLKFTNSSEKFIVTLFTAVPSLTTDSSASAT